MRTVYKCFSHNRSWHRSHRLLPPNKKQMKILQWEILIEKFLLETQFQIKISNKGALRFKKLKKFIDLNWINRLQSQRPSSLTVNCNYKLKYSRVRSGHEKPGKSWKWSISVSRPGKSWKIIVCVVRKLLQVPKQGQNKIQASCVRKYPKTRMSLTIFESGS